MFEIDAINIETLQQLAEYFHRNKSYIEKIYADFGAYSFNNGYGTIFLKPKNSLFKVFYNTRKTISFKRWVLGGESRTHSKRVISFL